MKAPTEKRNDTIQIIVSTACDLFNCSNCTQLLPFRRDVRHMSIDCFDRAVASVEDWPGVVALFGGNPCSHPRFEELCEILSRRIPQQKRRGIWTNNLLGHGRTVRDVFYPRGRFNVNAHAETGALDEIDRWIPGKLIRGSDHGRSWHSPILLDRRDYDITDDAWSGLREACDINVNWSSAIVERDGEPFAYFCEVAAAIDGVRGENHGISATVGWWRRGMDAFDHQVAECCDRGCGVPFRGKGHLDRDDVYDLSPRWDLGLSPKNQHGRVQRVVHLDLPDGCAEATDYMQLRTTREER